MRYLPGKAAWGLKRADAEWRPLEAARMAGLAVELRGRLERDERGERCAVPPPGELRATHTMQHPFQPPIKLCFNLSLIQYTPPGELRVAMSSPAPSLVSLDVRWDPAAHGAAAAAAALPAIEVGGRPLFKLLLVAPAVCHLAFAGATAASVFSRASALIRHCLDTICSSKNKFKTHTCG